MKKPRASTKTKGSVRKETKRTQKKNPSLEPKQRRIRRKEPEPEPGAQWKQEMRIDGGTRGPFIHEVLYWRSSEQATWRRGGCGCLLSSLDRLSHPYTRIPLLTHPGPRTSWMREIVRNRGSLARGRVSTSDARWLHEGTIAFCTCQDFCSLLGHQRMSNDHLTCTG